MLGNSAENTALFCTTCGHIPYDNTLVNKEYSRCLNCNMLKINGECLTVDSFDELRFLKGPENEPLSRDLKWDAL